MSLSSNVRMSDYGILLFYTNDSILIFRYLDIINIIFIDNFYHFI